jgi:hypothetical protein
MEKKRDLNNRYPFARKVLVVMKAGMVVANKRETNPKKKKP